MMTMKANPGGELDPKHVIGRDALIAFLWDRLEQQSVLIHAERRIGKSVVIKKMCHEPKTGWTPIYRNLENLSTAMEFAQQVFDDVQGYLGTTKKAVNWILDFFQKHEMEVSNLKLKLKSTPWKELLTSAIEDLQNSLDQNQEAYFTVKGRLVFFWDEVPYMIDKIRMNQGEMVAIDVLDTLRSLQGQYPSLRMVLTGSIGFHHVIGKLQASGIATQPLNKLYKAPVEPLTPEFGAELAKAILLGEAIKCPDLDLAARTIAESVDNFPYYIHLVVAGLKQNEIEASKDEIKTFVDQQLVNAADPWNLKHYHSRMTIYYPDKTQREAALAILDTFATIQHRLEVKEIQAELQKLNVQLPDRESLVKLLQLMDADHYLDRDLAGAYQFRFPLIRQWWKVDRSL